MRLETEKWILEGGKKVAYAALIPGVTGMIYSFSNPQPLADILPTQIRENIGAILFGSVGVSCFATYALLAINERLSQIERRVSDVQQSN
ncbi:MAG TPA: hypothetical protein VLE44_01500 [Candidatus Saccharimonadales bacterium]|nr:hypothetical protein [Candidatus Saccharimonadales bacterium]